MERNPADICPVEVEIELNGKPYMLKKWSLKVDAWIQARFGMDKVRFFQEMDTEKVGKLLFHLIDNKKDFQAKEIESFDDDGNLETKVITGPDQILDAISGSAKEQEIVNKILECYGLSQPQIAQLTGEPEQPETIKGRAKKKRKAKKSIGEKSLT